ncbi:MAG: membrane protein insertion efficiency factor YidD [Pseudomonadota bacterium]
MRWLVVLAIRAYQQLAPAALRRRCIFAESCSAHVARVASEEGLVSAAAALLDRFRKCRPGYVLVEAELVPGTRTRLVVFADGSCASSAVLRDTIGEL